jgi:hypothetical protein
METWAFKMCLLFKGGKIKAQRQFPNAMTIPQSTYHIFWDSIRQYWEGNVGQRSGQAITITTFGQRGAVHSHTPMSFVSSLKMARQQLLKGLNFFLRVQVGPSLSWIPSDWQSRHLAISHLPSCNLAPREWPSRFAFLPMSATQIVEARRFE